MQMNLPQNSDPSSFTPTAAQIDDIHARRLPRSQLLGSVRDAQRVAAYDIARDARIVSTQDPELQSGEGDHPATLPTALEPKMAKIEAAVDTKLGIADRASFDALVKRGVPIDLAEHLVAMDARLQDINKRLKAIESRPAAAKGTVRDVGRFH
jgi:hypothetical protein